MSKVNIYTENGRPMSKIMKHR